MLRLFIKHFSIFAVIFIMLSFATLTLGRCEVVPLTSASLSTAPGFTLHAQNSPSTSLKVIVILAEFSDAKHTVSSDEIKKRIFVEMNNYYKEVSYGGVSLTGDVIKDWIVLSKPFSSYGNLLAFGGSDIWSRRRQLVSDVVRAADDQVDFSQYNRVIIVVPMVPLICYAYRGSILTNDGVIVSWATVQREDRPASVFAHEIGHTLGLRDLYDRALAEKLGSSDAAAIYVGPWCLMSTAFRGSMHFCAYNKIVLGWIPPERIKVISPGSTEFVTVQPLGVKTQGIQVVKIPLNTQSYYLVEVRRKIGFDKVLPDEGMLITFVDETIQGDGFIKVKDAEPSTTGLHDATFDVRLGKKNAFVDAEQGLAIIVLYADDNGYFISVTTPSSLKDVSEMHTLLNQANSKLTEAGKVRFESPEATSLVKQAHDKYALAIELLKTKKNEAALQEIKSVISLTDRAFSAEQKYTEASGVISKAKDAIQKAESEGRTYGLDEAKSLLEQAQLALDTYNYDKALILAVKAKKTAETVSVPPSFIKLYGWYMGAAIVVAAVIGMMLIYTKRKGGR